MSIIRLATGELLIHSPAPLDDSLKEALDALGPVHFIVPASWLHGHLFMEQYVATYPEARLFAAPGLRSRRPDLTFNGDLTNEPDSAWATEIDQVVFVGGHKAQEVVFLHRPSRSLIVGDLVWNSTGLSWGLAAWVRLSSGNSIGPTAGYRLAIRDREGARSALSRLLEKDFDRIVVGHGAIVETGGRDALRQAFAWL